MSPHSQLLSSTPCTQRRRRHHLHTQQAERAGPVLMRARAHTTCDPLWTGPTWAFSFFPHFHVTLSILVNVIRILYTITRCLTMRAFRVLSSPSLSDALMLCALAHASITWWLAGPLSRGCYLLPQIFAGKSEAGIGTRRAKEVDLQYFQAPGTKFEG